MDQPTQPAAAESWQAELDELAERQRIARLMGGADRIARQHDGGRLTVRERIDLCLDPDSFLEIGSVAGQATYDETGKVMTGFMPANGVFGRGTIDGRPVVIYGDDFTVRGGSADASIRGKYFMPEQMAGGFRLPLIRMIEGSGGGGSVKTIETRGHANLPGGIGQSSGLWLCAQNMGRVPVVALGLGSVAGLGAARLAASHYSIMVRNSSACSWPVRPWLTDWGRSAASRILAAIMCRCRRARWTMRSIRNRRRSSGRGGSCPICPPRCGTCRRGSRTPMIRTGAMDT